MIRRVLMFTAVLTISIIPTVAANDCGIPKPNLVYFTYYSDYFTTINGQMLDQSCCNFLYDTWGTLDGETYIVERWSCNYPYEQKPTWCYEKVSGQWVQITCPF